MPHAPHAIARTVVTLLVVVTLVAPAAARKGKSKSEPKSQSGENGAKASAGPSGAKAGSAKPSPATGSAKPSPATKEKSYTFTGLDIDGKLKTPQLLYFLNR